VKEIELPLFFQIALVFSLFLVMIQVSLELDKSRLKGDVFRSKAYFLGFILQLFLIPLATLALISFFPAKNTTKIGALFIALCPGGILSNYYTLKAYGDVTLSVALTITSSVLSFISIPLGVKVFSLINEIFKASIDHGQYLKISLTSLVIGFIPIALGLCLQDTHLAKIISHKSLKRAPAFFIFFLILIIVYKNLPLFPVYLKTVAPLAIVLNAGFLLMGYSLAKALRLKEPVSRTLALETGLQNAGFALAIVPIATQSFFEITHIIGFWGFWHLITGALLSYYWSLKKADQEEVLCGT
jgi:BASS family bile acid:Na+ symporter